VKKNYKNGIKIEHNESKLFCENLVATFFHISKRLFHSKSVLYHIP